MSTEEHLKMFHCLVDTGADVLRNLAEIRLLDNRKKTFYQFLEDEKHYFYHQFEQKILCCECSPHGCTVSRGKMEAHVFNKVYEFKKERINKSHIVTNGMTNQKCLHAIHTRNMLLDDLDLSDLNYFLWTKGKLIPQENTAIKIIMDTRNLICHPSSTTCIGIHEINKLWTELENAILDLSQPERYKNMVKMCIESHRARQETQTEKILHGMNQIKETVKDELTKTRTDLTDESKEQTRMLRQLIGCFGNLSVFAQASQQVAADECQASGGNGQINMTTTLELPSLSNEEQRQIVEKFPSELKVGSEDKSITIDGKQVNSIVLDLRVSSSIFRDTETLRSALMSLIREVVDKGKIDTTVHDTIYVTMTFNSRLSSHETEVLTGLLTQEMSDFLYDVKPEGRTHIDTIDETEVLTGLLTQEMSDSLYDVKPEGRTHIDTIEKCLVCCQKDEYIEQLQKVMLSTNNSRTKDWVTEVLTNAPSDSAIDKSLTSGLPEDLIHVSSELFYLEESLEGLLDDLDIDKRIWLAVGISLHAIIATELRIYVGNFFSELYKSMVISDNIEKQTYPNYLKFHPKSKSRLNYKAINNNKHDHGTEIHKYDYRVQNATDASKLFLPIDITQYKDLHSCSLSSLIGIIFFKVDIIPRDAKDILREVCSNIRDIWTRCDFTQWDEAKFFYSFKLMEEFVKKLQLRDDEESIVLGNLNKWKNTVNIPHKQTSDTPRVIGSEINQEPTSTAYSVNIPKELQLPLTDTLHLGDTEIKQEQARSANVGIGHGVMGSMFCLTCRKNTPTINSGIHVQGLTRHIAFGRCALCKQRRSMILMR